MEQIQIDEDLIPYFKCKNCGNKVCKDEFFGGLCLDCNDVKADLLRKYGVCGNMEYLKSEFVFIKHETGEDIRILVDRGLDENIRDRLAWDFLSEETGIQNVEDTFYLSNILE